MPSGELKYKVRCTICSEQFTFDGALPKLHQHFPKDIVTIKQDKNLPCIGSGSIGEIIEPIKENY